MKWNIYWNANTETANVVISLTLMTYLHKMLKTNNNNTVYLFHQSQMFYNYVNPDLRQNCIKLVVLLRLEIPSSMCAKLRTVAASNNIDHARNLSIACSSYIYNGVILHAHPVRGESHNQCNATGEVATVRMISNVFLYRNLWFIWIFLSGSSPILDKICSFHIS